MTRRYRAAARLLTPLAALLVFAVAAPPAHAGSLGGRVGPAVSGTFTPQETTGSDTTVVHGVTDGTCDAPGSAGAPVDGFNAVVIGPGAFTPDPARGRPDGPAIVSTTDTGFSTTAPIAFEFRAGFRDLAQELGAPLLPGDYVVTFRCVNQFDGVIYQTFSTTFTFTGGPPAIAYTVTSTFSGSPAGGAPAGPAAFPAPLVWSAVGLLVLALAAVLLRVRRRRTHP